MFLFKNALRKKHTGLFGASLILLSLAVAHYAHAADTPPSFTYNGFFVGLAGGVGMMTGDFKGDGSVEYLDTLTGIADPTIHTLTYQYKENVDSFGIGGRASVGYGYCVGECWYNGIELSVLGMSANEVKGEFIETEAYQLNGQTETITAENIVTANIGVEGSLDYKTGFFLSREFMVYGRVGVGIADISVKSRIAFNSDSSHVIGAVDEEETKNELGVGLRLGLGVEQRLGQSMSVLLEYTFTDYGHFSFDQEAVSYMHEFDTLPPKPPLVGIMENDARVLLTQQMVLLGLTYHF